MPAPRRRGSSDCRSSCWHETATPSCRTARRLDSTAWTASTTLLRLLDAVPFEGKVPDSWFEELLARCIDDRSLPPIVPQCPILADDGRIVARTDLGIPSVKLGLEAAQPTLPRAAQSGTDSLGEVLSAYGTASARVTIP